MCFETCLPGLAAAARRRAPKGKVDRPFRTVKEAHETPTTS
jgi:hypothetical protein